ncbi:MAG: 16S rRNA (guanine(527)-N(7))-methyltransferase RsmG, partial [Thermomicrobiales bacterium]
PVLLEYVVPLLEIGGTALLPKGLEIESELHAGKRAATRLGARIVSATPLPGGTTRLVVAVKVAATPATYPRRVGVPSRDPLGDGE